MSLTLNSQVPSHFIIYKLQSTARVHVLIFEQLDVSLNVVFFIEILGTTPSIVFDDKENCHQEDNKKGLCGC
jgi:hypothetical protein